MAIEVSYLVNAVCQDSCPWFQVRNHDYEVPGPTLSGMADDHGTCASPGRCAKLCDATSSCCNRDFIRDTFLYGDLTNQAPSPIEPAFGPVTLSPQTIILDGTLANEKLEVQTFYEANALLIESGTTLVGAGVGLGTGNPILAIRLKLTLDLLLEYLTRTRNPVTTFQSPDEADGDCAYNVTLPYHGFEGQVKQCIREFPGDGVYSNIRGTGLETRLAGLNEFQGRRKFQALLYETRGKIDRVLAEAEAAGLCCTGATLHGGTVEWQEGQPKLVLDTTATENPPFALSIGEFGVVTTEGDIARSLTIDTGQTFEIAFRVDKSACSTLSLFRVEPYFAATADAPVDSLDRIGTGFNCGGAIDAAGFCGANVEQVRSPTVSRSNVTSVYPEAGTTSGVYEGYLVLTACDADDPLGGPPECARSSFPISVVVN